MPSIPLESMALMCQKCISFLSMLRNLWFLTSQTDILDEVTYTKNYINQPDFLYTMAGIKKRLEEEKKQKELEIRRTRMPRDKQVLGIVEQRLGGSRMHVRCLDGKNRICRIPGRLKRRLWVREGNFVIVEPWELGGDAKGDIIYKYRPTQVEFLKQKGMLKQLEDADEF